MKKKKILITVLILVLVCLSACGKKEVDSNSKDNLLGKWTLVEMQSICIVLDMISLSCLAMVLL